MQTIYIFFSLGHLVNASSDLMKLDHDDDDDAQLTEPYLSKQKKLMVRQAQKGFYY